MRLRLELLTSQETELLGEGRFLAYIAVLHSDSSLTGQTQPSHVMSGRTGGNHVSVVNITHCTYVRGDSNKPPHMEVERLHWSGIARQILLRGTGQEWPTILLWTRCTCIGQDRVADDSRTSHRGAIGARWQTPPTLWVVCGVSHPPRCVFELSKLATPPCCEHRCLVLVNSSVNVK